MGAPSTRPSTDVSPQASEPLSPHVTGVRAGSRQAPKVAAPVFRKVLYERQPFPDDYTDANFLAELILNLNVRRRSFWVVVWDSLAITQQLSLVTATALVFYAVLNNALSTPTLLTVNAAVLGVGLCARCTLRGALVGTLQALRETGVLVTGVYVLSPLLQSLTSTVSSDSVTALVVACLLVHLFLHDYTFSPAADVAATLSGSLSLGAAICASVLLASRLDDTLQVFGIVCCGLQAFVAWPFLRRDIRAAWPNCHVVMTCALHAATCAALARVSAVLAAVHVAAVLFITFACPWWLVQCHDIKQRINGPWDEARIVINQIT